MWWMLTATASTLVLGEPGFRAPDGIATARVANDGTAWVMSPRGEIAGFDPKGHLRTTFQACPDRAPHLFFVIDPSGTRAGVDCGPTFRVLALPTGELQFEVGAFTTDAAFSPDGRKLALLGERIVDGVSEATSNLLRYDATSGAPLDPIESDWEAIWGVEGGWIGATTREREDGPLYVEGRIQVGVSTLNWRWLAPVEQRTTSDWGPREAVAVMDGGTRVCVQVDFGGACLDGRTGGPRNFWSVPKADRRDATRAQPHPDGLAMGTEIWFERLDGVYHWGMDGSPERLPRGASIAVADTAGKYRYRVEQARLVPVDATGRDDHDALWGLPVAVDRTADGQELLIADERGRVFLQKLAGGVRRIEGSADRVKLAPDGSSAWLFEEGEPTRVVSLSTLEGPATRRSPVVAFEGGRTYAVEYEGEVPWLTELGEKNRLVPLPEALEITGLQAAGDLVLVEYGQDDAWQLYKPGTLGPLTAQPFADQTDLLLTRDGVLGVAEDPGGWRVGSHVVPWTSVVRFLGTGTQFIELPVDATSVEVRDHLTGALRETHELPGRWSHVWTRDRLAIVALRDGRLVLLDL
ncbi:MAG: hypothetical protein R3F61_10465 [Myxococcota bacterium]